MTPEGEGVPFIGEVLTQKDVLYIYTESLSIQLPPKACSVSELYIESLDIYIKALYIHRISIQKCQLILFV